MIYLKRLWNLIWYPIRIVFVFVMFFPTLVIDLIVAPFIYYIVTGHNYYTEFDPLVLGLCTYISALFGEDMDFDINDTIIGRLRKEKWNRKKQKD